LSDFSAIWAPIWAPFLAPLAACSAHFRGPKTGPEKSSEKELGVSTQGGGSAAVAGLLGRVMEGSQHSGTSKMLQETEKSK